MKSICVYCGSSDRIPKIYLDAASLMGKFLASSGYTLIYGGGSTGVMGVLANSVLQAGGMVIGVIPEMFNTPSLVHNSLTRLEIVENIHVRKARMAELADAFIALPGGFGTFEELFEILTWAQIGLHEKPIGILNVAGYYDPLLELIAHAARQGFLYQEHQDLIIQESDPESLLAALLRYRLPENLHQWVQRDTENKQNV